MRFVCVVLFSVLGLAKGFALAQPSPGLRDKIGQMLLIGFDGKHVEAHSDIVKQIQQNNIGGVILFDHDFKTDSSDKNIESPAQVRQLNQDLQKYTQQGNAQHHRPNLKLIISVDYEGGNVTRLKEQYGFPATPFASEVSNLSISEAQSAAKQMASTLKSAGFNLNFAPVLDMNVNPDNPIIGKKKRSFSNDAQVVTVFADLFSQEYLKQHIQCVYKHFPGHGSSTTDSHLEFVDVSNTWSDKELEPYRKLLSSETHCGVVMSAHIVNRQLDPTGLPATLSYKILTGLLRHQLNFKGVIITDDLQMKAIRDHYGLDRTLVLAINAGADMLIFGNNLSMESQNPKQLIDIIESKVNSGEISVERIEEAYQHITTLKGSLNTQ